MNVTFTQIEYIVGIGITVVSLLYPVTVRLQKILSSHLSLHQKLDAVEKELASHKAILETAGRDIVSLVSAAKGIQSGHSIIDATGKEIGKVK